jgi:hypothetical protein
MPSPILLPPDRLLRTPSPLLLPPANLPTRLIYLASQLYFREIYSAPLIGARGWNIEWNTSMAILKLAQPDEEREIDFTIESQQKLTVQQRFSMLEERKKAFLEQLIRYGHRKPFEIIKRS